MEGGRLIEGGGGALITFFLMIVIVTGPRRLENGLFVLRKFSASTRSAAVGQKLKEKIMHIKELCKRMVLETTISDLTEKKLFSYMYSNASAVGA